MIQSKGRIKIKEHRFTDCEGRQVLLHGLNMVCKDESLGFIGNWTDQDFAKLRAWGLNVIRLGINWSRLEPRPGEYDDAYIEAQRRIIRLANRYDVRVFLDMHQDLYSTLFGNGAPAWATITDGETYEPGAVWSDAYLFNKAVQKAFDHFWKNTLAEDGTGIQDHFIQAWGYLVRQLHGEPNLIGYDIINEPFIGSDANLVIAAMISKYADLYQERHGESEWKEPLHLWGDADDKQSAFSMLEQSDIFGQVIDAPSEVLQSFEREALSLLYRRAAAAIRESDPDGILFLETNYFSNLGAKSMIQPVIHADGVRDPQQAYAPHAYDLVTDTELAHTANDHRLEMIIARHGETRQRLQMPMLIGEWGAFYGSVNTGHVALHIQRALERQLCSDTYWDYTPEMDSSPAFMAVRRAYPMALSGKLRQYRYEHSIRSYSMRWEESEEVTAPTIIYLPDIRHLTPDHITLSPPGSSYVLHAIEGSNAGYMEIPAMHSASRLLVIAGA